MSLCDLQHDNNNEFLLKKLTAKQIATDTFTANNILIGAINTASLTTSSITLSNKITYSVGLYYSETTANYINLIPSINISFWLIDKILFLEIPEITATLPPNCSILALAQTVTPDPSISWPFTFKYEFYQQATAEIGGPSVEQINTAIDNTQTSAIYLYPLAPGYFQTGTIKIFGMVRTFLIN